MSVKLGYKVYRSPKGEPGWADPFLHASRVDSLWHLY